jgi:hypothetical protein
VNGDGCDDLIVGAKLADAKGRTDAGTVYVLFGHAGNFSNVALDTYSFDSATGFKIVGAIANYNLGGSVRRAGDVNGDTIADLIIGASGTGKGVAYVIFGHSTGTPFVDIDLLSFVSGPTGFEINGAAAGGGEVNTFCSGVYS